MAVTHQLQSYCHMRNRQNMFFLELRHNKVLKISNSSDLSFGANCSQSCDTIPLMLQKYLTATEQENYSMTQPLQDPSIC